MYPVDKIEPFDLQSHLNVVFATVKHPLASVLRKVLENNPWCVFAILSEPQHTETRRHHHTLHKLVQDLIREIDAANQE